MVSINRLGFTDVSNRTKDQEPPLCNIIFVHGLRGHPKGTWTSKQGDQPELSRRSLNGHRIVAAIFGSRNSKSLSEISNKDDRPKSEELYWPQDLLPEDIPEARIWTYGYNADVIGVFQANNQSTISQHGRDLANKIEREIDNKDPIVFVAHSLGGILVKDALHKSVQSRLRTKLIVFLGTPHRGSSSADWGQLATNMANMALLDTNEKIIKTLRVDSEVLENIHNEFKDIVTVKDSAIKIHSFFEGRGVSGMKGISGKVVNDFSSKVDLPSGVESVEGIDANHMQMARCNGRDDDRYRAIMNVLRNGISAQIVQAEKEKLSQLKAESEEKKQKAKELEEQSRRSMLDSLAFPAMNRRYSAIPTDASLESGKWLFENELYKNWEQDPCSYANHDFLILRGRLGSGKSFLMKRAVQYAEAVSNTRNLIVLHFFFDADEFADRSGTVDVVKELSHSLLFQLVRKAKSFSANFFAQYDYCSKYSWSEPDLLQAMRELSSHCYMQGLRIRVYLDEMDRCKDIFGVSDYLQAVRNKSHEDLDLKFCVSSQHDRSPLRILDNAPTIIIEEHSYYDLNRFLRKGLECITISHLQEKELDVIVEHMAHGAAGNFLWARLVFDDFVWNAPRDDYEFCDRIKNTPKKMSALYGKALSRLAGNSKGDCLSLFQILLFTTKPVTSHWLKHALAYLSADSLSEQAFQKALFRLGEGDHFTARIGALSQELVQFRKGPRPTQHWQSSTDANYEQTYVGFIHSTTRQYLLTEGLATIDGSLQEEVTPKGHLRLFELCMKVIDMDTLESEIGSPVMQYAGSQWVHHGRLAGRHLAGIEFPKCMVQCGYKASKLVTLHQSYYSDNPALNSSHLQGETNLMVILAAEGFSEAFQEHIDRCRACTQEHETSNGNGAPSVWDRALFHATFSKHVSVVQILHRKAGKRCDPNRMINGSNAIYRACLEGQIEIVEHLLQMGGDVLNRVQEVYITGLHAAVTRNKAKVIKTLFGFDGRVTRQLLELRGREDSTPLHIAALYNRVESAKAILEQIEDEKIPAEEIFALQDKNGKTPLDLAREKGNKHLLSLCEDLSHQQADEKKRGVERS